MASSCARLVFALALVGTCALILPAPFAAPALAQGEQQTMQLAKVDVAKVSGGLQASQIIGSSVVNEAREWVGEIDDIIVGRDGKSSYAVLSVGTYLGTGAHYVAVPCNELKVDERRITLPGATKETLRELPEFKYAAR